MCKLTIMLLLTVCLTPRETFGQDGKTCDDCASTLLSSTVLLFVNVPVNTVNIIQLINGEGHSNFIPIAGLVGGATQIALGIHSYPRWQVDPDFGGRSR